MFTDIFTTKKKYGVIYADPAWQYKDKCNSGQRGAGFKYRTSSLEEMKALPVADIAADNCVLFMWHVPPQPEAALELLKAWGFTFKTMKGFTWVKLNKRNGLPFMGMGNWTRGNAEDCLVAVKGDEFEFFNVEDCLIAVRGKPDRISKAVRSLVMAPIRDHSQKPDEVRRRIEELMGYDLPRIELFSRDIVPGWDCWGDEVA